MHQATIDATESNRRGEHLSQPYFPSTHLNDTFFLNRWQRLKVLWLRIPFHMTATRDMFTLTKSLCVCLQPRLLTKYMVFAQSTNWYCYSRSLSWLWEQASSVYAWPQCLDLRIYTTIITAKFASWLYVSINLVIWFLFSFCNTFDLVKLIRDDTRSLFQSTLGIVVSEWELE